MPIRKNKEVEDKQKQLFEKRQELSISVAKTDEGIEYLRWLRDLCGFGVCSININPISGEISDKNTLYQEARKSVYLELRKYFPKKLLTKIELGDKK